jgi:hypothetical protein
VIDGALFPKPHGRGGMALATPPMGEREAVEDDSACRLLADPATRLAHKDRMGVGLQVIYPTLFIACEADEAIAYLVTHIGEDNLLIGSDYGHHDQSAEPELVPLIRARKDIAPAVVDKVLSDNQSRF